jgi:hypothetical protein
MMATFVELRVRMSIQSSGLTVAREPAGALCVQHRDVERYKP